MPPLRLRLLLSRFRAMADDSSQLAFAEWIAQTLWADVRRAPSERPPATRLTQRRRSEGRGNEYTASITPTPRPTNVCAGCGTTTKRGQHCPSCGREISRQKLIEVAKRFGDT